MSQYVDNNELFLNPRVKQYGSHMVMSNVHKPTKTKFVNIDTKFSDEYNIFEVANYNITLPERINNIKTLTVSNIELPMSFYNISSALGNNSFKITNLEVDPAFSFLNPISTGSINSNNQFVDTIVIPDGYYTMEELKNTINSLIQKIKRIPSNSHGEIVLDNADNIIYEADGTTILTLTATNCIFNTDGTIKYNVDGNGNFIVNSIGFYEVTLIDGATKAYVSNGLKNTNDLRFDYYVKGSHGNQCFFYSTSSQMIIDFAVNKEGSFDKYNFKSKLGWVLGFRELNYTITHNYQPTEVDNDPTDGTGPDGQELTYGKFLADLNTPRYVYLALEEFNKGQQNSFISTTSSSLINKNIIGRITLDRTTYGFGSYLPANKANGMLLSDIRNYNGNMDLNKLNLQIISDTGIPLPLNGYDFSLCLEVEYD